jgi:gamma-glutamyltranspeptidase / glutathione hydrolase
VKRIAAIALLVVSGCRAEAPVAAPAAAPVPVPAEASVTSGKEASTEQGMIASAHPLASAAGLEMLRNGGNAVDAAVATAFALGVVEPMMAGIGGSGGMLIWNQESGRADYLDFYARAPAGVEPDAAERRSDHPARLVAIPGTVAGLLTAHERFGRLDRAAVLEPAIRLAREGFPISGLLARTIVGDSATIARNADGMRLLWPGGRPLGPGERLVQPELAATMQRISRDGRAGFHDGPVAEEIVRVLRAGGNPITVDDIRGFEPIWRRPMCGVYRGLTVLSAPPPQSGMQIIQALNILNAHDLRARGLPARSAESMDILAGALRVAAADRLRYLGDPDRVGVPAVGIASPGYAEQRAREVLSGERATARILSGDPRPFEETPPHASCAPHEPFGSSALSTRTPEAGVELELAAAESEDDESTGETTHFSVVDGDGNAVSLTFTQGAYYGSGMFAAGTFLNNAMGIFSADRESPNFLRPGHGPGSTTTPTILLEDGGVRMVVGSPGGGRIPQTVVQAIVYAVDFGMSPLEALRMPRIFAHSTVPRIEFEQGVPGHVLEGLRGFGYELEVHAPASLYFGGAQMIERRDGRWVGAADPRRDGEAHGH